MDTHVLVGQVDGCAHAASEVWPAAHVWGKQLDVAQAIWPSNSAMLLWEGPHSPAATYVYPQFILLIYAALRCKSSAAIHN